MYCTIVKMQNLLILLLIIQSFDTIVYGKKMIDTSHMLLSRQKRTLIFQPGLNWIQMIAGIGLPVELKDQSITLGAVVKSYYRVPNNSSDFTRPTITVARKRRNITRWHIYEMLIELLERYGYRDSKACLLRSICEVSSMPFDEKSGLFTEILQIILRPSSTNDFMGNYLDVVYKAAEKFGKEEDNNCHVIFPDCKSNFLNKFIR